MLINLSKIDSRFGQVLNDPVSYRLSLFLFSREFSHPQSVVHLSTLIPV